MAGGQSSVRASEGWFDCPILRRAGTRRKTPLARCQAARAWDPLVPAKNERCSTQPASPFALIRRHPPRDSPSCTRVFGPMEAMMRDCGLALARTTTQLLAIEFTQRVLLFAFGAATTVFVDRFTGALATVLASF